MTGEQQTEYVSLSSVFGQNSMEAWTRTLLEDRRCMDCKAEVKDLDGTMEFQGRPPHIELIGHLCQACRDQREEIRRYRLSLIDR